MIFHSKGSVSVWRSSLATAVHKVWSMAELCHRIANLADYAVCPMTNNERAWPPITMRDVRTAINILHSYVFHWVCGEKKIVNAAPPFSSSHPPFLLAFYFLLILPPSHSSGCPLHIYSISLHPPLLQFGLPTPSLHQSPHAPSLAPAAHSKANSTEGENVRIGIL